MSIAFSSTRATASTTGVHVTAAPTTSSETAPMLLPEADAGSLPILGRLHLLMIKSSQANREADRQLEEKLDAEERAADEKRLQEMRDKASSSLAFGLVSSGLQLASAAGSIIASANTLSEMRKHDAVSAQLRDAKAINGVPSRAPITATVARLEGEEKAAERLEMIASKTGDLVSGAAKGVDGAKTGVDAFAGASKDRAQVRITEYENQAKNARRAADRLKSEQDAAKQSEARVMQLAAEIAQAQAQCERAALLRM
jgi:hypothetical protein